MKEIRMSSQFKKDFKRYKNDSEKIKALYDVVGYLERGEQIPSTYKPHMLKGELKGIMECHIESNYLLLWLDETTNVVRLLRLGTHSEVLGM